MYHKVCPYCGETWITHYNQCCSWKCFVNYCFENALPLDEFKGWEESEGHFQRFESNRPLMEQKIDEIECQIEDILDDEEEDEYLKRKIEKIWKNVRDLGQKLL